MSSRVAVPTHHTSTIEDFQCSKTSCARYTYTLAIICTKPIQKNSRVRCQSASQPAASVGLWHLFVLSKLGDDKGFFFFLTNNNNNIYSIEVFFLFFLSFFL